MTDQPNTNSRLAAAVRGERQPTPFEIFRKQLNALHPDIIKVAGSKEKADKFVRVALNAVQAVPKVLEADRRSLFLACMECAMDGLIPDGREAVFNIYPTKRKEGGREIWEDIVQYMPMAYGLIQLVYEAGATYVDGVAVYERDDFDYQRGDEPRIVHKPYKGTDDPGEIIAAYVVVKLRTGEMKREVMFARDIAKVRGKSKAPSGLMWKDFPDQGAIKSVIHRIFKQLPAARESEKLARALAHDNAAVGLAEVAPSPEQSAETMELAALIDGRFDEAQRRVPPVKVQDAETVARENAAAQGAGAPVQGQRVEPEGERIPHGAGAGAPSGRGGPTKEAAQDDKAPPAKIGDPGTPELKQKILAKITAATDAAFVWAEADLADMFTWANPADLQEIKAAAKARSAELDPQ